MNTQVTIDEAEEFQEKPGAQLALVRVQKGYSTEYVAGKLHLRVRLIELLEADDYANMAEPVFIKGYLRAYAKLLEVPHQPLLDTFNRHNTPDRKLDKALWQSRRETNKAEHAVRWLTAVFAVVVLIAVAMWWQTSKETEHTFPAASVSAAEPVRNLSETEIRLTDLSKMRSLLSSPVSQQDILGVENTLMEKQGG